MRKLIAVVCVIAWTGFWAFGYLAVTAGTDDSSRGSIAILLAAVAFLTGIFTYMRLSRDQQIEWKRVRPPADA